MLKTKYIRFLFFCALISITGLLNAQSTGYIKKRDWEDNGFKGGVFIGLGAKITNTGTETLLGGTEAANEILWKDLIGVSQSGNTLTKTDSSLWGNAGGASDNQLKSLENGWLNYKVNNIYNKLAFGFSNININAGLDSIKYAVMLDSGHIHIYNNGTLIGNFGSAAINDSIRLERIGNVLFYTKNKILFYTQDLNPKQTLMVDAAIYTQGAALALTTSASAANSNAYFRSKQTGDWNQLSTWQSSVDSSAWTDAVATPDKYSKSIIIQSAHTVTITASVVIDQTIINGTLIYGNNSGSVITINDGTGTDFMVNGTFQDIGPSSIVWSGSSSWQIAGATLMGPGGTLLRTRNTSSDNWRVHYQGGITNIPSSAKWIIRKTGTDNPSLSSVSGMYYPNLTIENTSGSSWTASGTSGFTGSTDYPRIKGNFYIGGSGTNPVVFVNQNTDSIPIFVSGNLTVKSGSTLQNNGTGFNVADSLSILGFYTGTKKLYFSGNNIQRISDTTFSTIKTLNVNKTGGHLVLNTPVKIDSVISLTKGYIVTDSINLLTINKYGYVRGGGNSSYVFGPVKKIGNTGFIFPLGDPTVTTGPYHPLVITAPDSLTDAFVGIYSPMNQPFSDSLQTDSLDNISNCEHWVLKRMAGTSAVIPSLGWNANSCNVLDYPDLKVAHWTGTRWEPLGNGVVLVDGYGGTVGGVIPVYVDYAVLVIGNRAGSVGPYPLVKRQLDGGYYLVSDGKLCFKYDEEYSDLDGKLKFNIYDNHNSIVASDALMPIGTGPSVNYGDNRYTLNIASCSFTPNGNLGSGFYILEIINEKNEKWYLRFKNTISISGSCATIYNPLGGTAVWHN